MISISGESRCTFRRRKMGLLAATLITAGNSLLSGSARLNGMAGWSILKHQSGPASPLRLSFQKTATSLKQNRLYLGEDLAVAYVISILPRIRQMPAGGISWFANKHNHYSLCTLLRAMLIGQRWNSTSTAYCRSAMTNTQNVITKST